MQDVHVKLPDDVMARLKDEKARRGIPVNLLVRECVMQAYGSEAVSNDFRISTETIETMQPVAVGNTRSNGGSS